MSTTTPSLKNQLEFTGSANCDKFSVNSFLLNAKNAKMKCKSCSNLFSDHAADAVTEDDVDTFLSHQEASSGANCVLDSDTSNNLPGRVFLGGRSASCNPFVREHQIRRVVNASDLHLVARTDFQTLAQRVRGL